MASSRDVNQAGAYPPFVAFARFAGRFVAAAPTWLRALSVFAFVRAVAIVALTILWVRAVAVDNDLGVFSVVAWAVSALVFELLAGVTLLSASQGRMPRGVSLALTIVAFVIFAIGVVLLIFASLFSGGVEPALALGLIDTVFKLPLMAGMLWPAILGWTEAIEARLARSKS